MIILAPRKLRDKALAFRRRVVTKEGMRMSNFYYNIQKLQAPVPNSVWGKYSSEWGKSCPGGVILSVAAFQAQRTISQTRTPEEETSSTIHPAANSCPASCNILKPAPMNSSWIKT